MESPRFKQTKKIPQDPTPCEETVDFSKAVWVTNAIWLQTMLHGLAIAKTVSESSYKSLEGALFCKHQMQALAIFLFTT
jgi:hypothetical protein